MPVVLALDIGGSGVRAAAVSSGSIAGRVHREALSATSSPDEVRAAVLRCARAALPADATRVGVSFPAFLGHDGAVIHSVNLPGLEGTELARVVTAELELPAIAIPDLAATTLAEARLGAGAGHRRVLCVAIGTGVNAALAVSGDVVDLAFGCLGDAGHVNVEPDGPRCPCGGRGCLEAICSGFALAQRAREHGWADAAAIHDHVRRGDPDALDIVRGVGTALGRAVATWSAMTAPDIVIVGGGVAEFGEPLLSAARRELARVGVPYLVGKLTITSTRFGSEAALIGAALACDRSDGREGSRSR